MVVIAVVVVVVFVKFEVCVLSCSRDIKGSQNFKVGHVTQVTPLLTYFCTFVLCISYHQSACKI